MESRNIKGFRAMDISQFMGAVQGQMDQAMQIAERSTNRHGWAGKKFEGFLDLVKFLNKEKPFHFHVVYGDERFYLVYSTKGNVDAND